MALPQTVLRPLGTYEQYSSSRHSLGLYHNVITVCRYQLPAPGSGSGSDAGPLGDDAVKASITAALATVVLDRLPSLRVGVAGEHTKKPVFVAVPSLDLRDHVEWVSRAPGLAPAEYDALLAADMARDNARDWPGGDVATRPPWRLVGYLNTADGWADLAFALHHAVGDGKSGLMFHTHLAEVLNSPPPAGPNAAPPLRDVLEFSVLPALVPPQEDLIQFRITWLFFFKTLWAELVPRWLKPAPAAAHYTGPRVSLHEHKLDGALRLFHLSPRQAAAVLAGCRARGTTLTALVQGLMMVLFARRVPADVASSFVCIMPISTRVAIAPSSSPVSYDVHRHMGNFVCGHHYVYEADAVADARLVASTDDSKAGKDDMDDDKVWRAAAALGADLKERVANLRTDNVMGLMSWIGDWHQYWLQQDGKIRESTWGVSNTGAIADGTASSCGQWKLTRNFYSQSSLGKDSLINVNVGSVRGGDMSFIVAWHRGVVEDDFGHRFADDLRDCLVRYAETGHFAVPDRLANHPRILTQLSVRGLGALGTNPALGVDRALSVHGSDWLWAVTAFYILVFVVSETLKLILLAGLVNVPWLLHSIAWALGDGSSSIGVTGSCVFTGTLDVLQLPVFASVFVLRARKWDFAGLNLDLSESRSGWRSQPLHDGNDKAGAGIALVSQNTHAAEAV